MKKFIGARTHLFLQLVVGVFISSQILLGLSLTQDEEIDKIREEFKLAIEDKLVQKIEEKSDGNEEIQRANLRKLLDTLVASEQTKILKQDEEHHPEWVAVGNNPEALSQVTSILEAIFTGNVNFTRFREHTQGLVPAVVQTQFDNLVKYFGGGGTSTNKTTPSSTPSPPVNPQLPVVEFEAAAAKKKIQKRKRQKPPQNLTAEEAQRYHEKQNVGILEVLLGKERFNMTDFVTRRLPSLYKDTKGALDFLDEIGVIDYDLIGLFGQAIG